jgi:hypothetical protein
MIVTPQIRLGKRPGLKPQARTDRHESWLFSAGQDRDKLEVPDLTIGLACNRLWSAS